MSIYQNPNGPGNSGNNQAMLLIEDGTDVDMSGIKLPVGKKAPQNRSVSQLENPA